MPDETVKPIADLEQIVSYIFTDRSLLDEALTHPSFVNESGGKVRQDNQRLEFLGDAVIGLILSHELFSRFPGSREGELTKLRASLVDEASLALLAGKIHLGAFLRLGRGEEKSGGRDKPSLLADAYEALVAAIYLDGGMEPAASMVKRHFAPLVENGEMRTTGRDFKTDFQELAHRLCGLAPRYQLQGVSGPDHERIFSVAVLLGEELLGEGAAKSKKEAEQAAARQGIALLKKRQAP
ncbi:ribonuclease III [Geotalea sp. SG265]|uniref:ribonuclease III n=1 Tax=Geotalea sp. SG265 TaxID=2922867 RepID=UPI001FAE90D0|nr:ribonuclease III [Geotalea sp. SG265]